MFKLIKTKGLRTSETIAPTDLKIFDSASTRQAPFQDYRDKKADT